MNTSKRRNFFGLGLAAVLVAPAVLADQTVTVSQRGREFQPATVSIVRGTVVHVVNDDNVTHHVYVESPKMTFDSGEQPIGATADLRFDHAGNFLVRCAIDPTMRLAVTVQ